MSSGVVKNTSDSPQQTETYIFARDWGQSNTFAQVVDTQGNYMTIYSGYGGKLLLPKWLQGIGAQVNMKNGLSCDLSVEEREAMLTKIGLSRKQNKSWGSHPDVVHAEPGVLTCPNVKPKAVKTP